MTGDLNETNHSAKGAGLGSGGLKEAEHTLSAIKSPGNPVLALAGAGVKETEQVIKMKFCLSPSNTNLDTQISNIAIKESNLLDKNMSREALSHIETRNKFDQASNHTQQGNILNNFENSINKTNYTLNDNFSSDQFKYFEFSLKPAELTIVNLNLNMSKTEFFKVKTKYSGAEIRQYKKAKREEARKEAEARETPAETEARKFVESQYNVRNKSYAQAAKAAGGRMLEVRSHNQDYLLEQVDYNLIDTKCGMEFLRLWREGDKADYYIKGGLSQGGVWMSCKNDITLALAKKFIGTLSSPNGEGGMYKVYGEDEKPFLYIQAWIPGRWWELRAELFDLICFSNRWLVEPLEDGQVPHFRLSSGLVKRKVNDRGFFECTFEVDENLFPLIAQKKGQFDIVMSTTKFFGSGIVAAAKRLIMEEYERMLDSVAE